MISAFNLKIFFDDVEPIGIVRMIIQGTTDSFIGKASDAGGKILKKEATNSLQCARLRGIGQVNLATRAGSKILKTRENPKIVISKTPVARTIVIQVVDLQVWGYKKEFG